MPWKETGVMEERIRFVAGALKEEVNFSRLCEDFGVSRPTGYRWFKRYRECGSFGDLKERSRRPLRSPRRTVSELEDRVIELRKRYGWGAKKLHVVLLRDAGIDLPVITIHRIIYRNGLIVSRKSLSHATKRFEKKQPNELWQMDFKGEYHLGKGYCYPLSILDDHSRFTVGLYGLPNQRGESVNDCLVRTFDKFGVPHAMLMDHGTPWWSSTNAQGLTWVTVKMIRQGIRIYLSGVGHPQTQGKVERFHRTLKQSVRHTGKPKTMEGWNSLLRNFREEYNHLRPHEALGMDVPASRYEPSRKPYNPNPPEWDYPEGSVVTRLNTQGCLEYDRKRYFVCEALAKENVRIEEIENRLLVSYRQMYIREIERETGKTRALLVPGQEL